MKLIKYCDGINNLENFTFLGLDGRHINIYYPCTKLDYNQLSFDNSDTAKVVLSEIWGFWQMKNQ